MVQAAFLALLCGEQAAPFGGVMAVTGTPDALSLVVTGDKLAPRPEHWGWLTDALPGDLDDLPTAQVQFALLPDLLADLGRPASVSLGDPVTLAF
ncbi:histidine phosphotransferase family protein [Roseovarius dicentrarchi]|uniref:histidine phosphotransferase family protein n=1 Tax=Roseovarius dicentrarchi TaxID=2250573 RepID=UPI001EF111E4|nr:histidine phosphotransferase family protein [Roseovarius dicentrarchi]